MAVTTSSTASWGVNSAPGGTPNGVVTDISLNTESVRAYEQNELGAVIGVHHYDTHVTADITVMAAKDTAVPAMGDTITVGAGFSGCVISTTVLESNRDFRKIRVQAEQYVNEDTLTDLTGE